MAVPAVGPEAWGMRRNWPQWIGYLTALVSFGYGVLGLYWSLGGAGFPFGVGDPTMVESGRDAIAGNLLGFATPEPTGAVFAVAGLLGAILALLLTRGVGRGPARIAFITAALVIAFALTIVIQDYRPLIVVAYTPILTVSKLLFGWPEGVGFGDLYQWPSLNLLILQLLGIAWILTALAYKRRTADACGNCGRDGHGTGSRLVQWGKPAVVVAVVTPLIYCTTRWLWALGFTLGIDAEWYREGQENGLWLAGAALASLGALGAVLTLGLIQRWGEVFPRWMIGLRGKRVPPMLAVVPATVVAMLVTSAGSMYIRMAFVMGVEDKWVTNMPETLWPVWGAALFVAALSYHRRRRLACGVCGRD
ncbi:hypothetical protein Snas_1732 [Stackebrandtia nassauensis DSM 44728]|uniref:Uncharacterized protein n=2 Tax=Stackebrandtia TaxID=283810 RepID=D3PXG7_STANL|nr:hypothetical protein Snas_1732 [Stackebrandtia nassauensis DSM 44728]